MARETETGGTPATVRMAGGGVDGRWADRGGWIGWTRARIRVWIRGGIRVWIRKGIRIGIVAALLLLLLLLLLFQLSVQQVVL